MRKKTGGGSRKENAKKIEGECGNGRIEVEKNGKKEEGERMREEMEEKGKIEK